jgi:hypothetical protein
MVVLAANQNVDFDTSPTYAVLLGGGVISAAVAGAMVCWFLRSEK